MGAACGLVTSVTRCRSRVLCCSICNNRGYAVRMGRYVRDGHSWQIERDGTTLTITEDDGAERVEQLADAKAAATRFTILTNQKLRAGWKLWKPPEEPVQAT